MWNKMNMMENFDCYLVAGPPQPILFHQDKFQ